jgi:hypothetical protein
MADAILFTVGPRQQCRRPEAMLGAMTIGIADDNIWAAYWQI